MTRLIAAIAAAGIVALIAITWLLTSSRQETACGTSTIAGGAAAIGGPFELLDANGDTVTDADVIDGPTLVYFGYTFCPDVCPLDNARNALAVDILDERGYDVTPVFISIDPERDTPEVVGDFSANMHPKMVGLTGTAEQVKAASRAYKTYYARGEGDDDYYLMDHSTFTYLMFPGTGFATHFGRDETPEQIADITACFIENAK